MKRDYELFIKDLLECINKIEDFVGEMSFDEFMKDEKTKSAVVREIEVMGEAVKNIPSSIRERYKDIPWNQMAKTRDKIIHFYFGGEVNPTLILPLARGGIKGGVTKEKELTMKLSGGL